MLFSISTSFFINFVNNFILCTDLINGYKSYIHTNGQKAIWYFDLQWVIGAIDGIGGPNFGIHSIVDTAKDCPGKVHEEKWKYWDSSQWVNGGTDIQVECPGSRISTLCI